MVGKTVISIVLVGKTVKSGKLLNKYYWIWQKPPMSPSLQCRRASNIFFEETSNVFFENTSKVGASNVEASNVVAPFLVIRRPNFKHKLYMVIVTRQTSIIRSIQQSFIGWRSKVRSNKTQNDSKRFSNNFFVRCSATFERLVNSVKVLVRTGIDKSLYLMPRRM